ncbi:MAG TPA: OsmC family protein [Anaerolineae bacterium]
MPNIESSPFPLVFRVPEHVVELSVDDPSALSLRTYVRVLEGMQKEALVALATPSGRHIWRMVSDEGPYLQGTDLAPFPLAFFTAGMQFSLLSELLRHAEANGVSIQRLSLSQDNYYTMEGSALQATMIGGAKPPEVTIKVEADSPAEIIAHLIRLAQQSSPAHALMRDVLSNAFALTFNDRALNVTDLNPSAESFTDDVGAVFDNARPDNSAEFRDAIITRVSQARQLFGVEGGAASSLQAEQKRTLHVHGGANWLGGRLLETTIQLYRPIGSTFRFVCDETRATGGQESAPPPLAYLAAGIGFCYMTQIGRYAHITKQKLNAYRIIQDNTFIVGETARALPLDTHVFLEADEPDEVARKTVWMSERTCFLHAAMRGSYPSAIQVELNGG